MWAIAKIKKSEINLFKKEIFEKIGKDTLFYIPKVKVQNFKNNKLQNKEKYVLEDYIFCFNKKFNNENSLQLIKFIKGLKYFLPGFLTEQKNIEKFINYCKSFEDAFGYLNFSFFNTIEKNYLKFVSGPFTNMIFKILVKNKDKFKILIGDIPVSVSTESDFIFVDNK